MAAIGRVLASRLAENGQNLIIVERNRERLNVLAGELSNRHNVRVRVLVQDLSLPDAAQALLDGCSGFPISRLINNAGFEVPLGPFQSSKAQAITAMLQVNIVALTELTRLFLPQIIAHGGSIINVASHAAFQPVPYMSAYVASKSFDSTLARPYTPSLLSRIRKRSRWWLCVPEPRRRSSGSVLERKSKAPGSV